MGNDVTHSQELNRVGKKLFGEAWIGIHPSNVKPIVLLNNVRKSRGLHYALLNTGNDKSRGIHRVALIVDPRGEHVRYYIYDSFARHLKRIIPGFIKKIGYRYIVDMNLNSDQKEAEQNCGQRSMATMLYVSKHGLTNAMLI